MTAKKKAVKRAAAKRSVVVKKSARKAPAKQTALKLPRIGADWPGQAGKFMGIICGENGQPDYGIVLPTDPRATLKGIYSPKENITGAQSELDGMANTKAMAAAGSKIAKDALAVKIDGHRDFYIPSRREARLLQINSPTPIAKGWHWTSTQCRGWDDLAWAQNFGDGNQHDFHKYDELPVRLVRRVAI